MIMNKVILQCTSGIILSWNSKRTFLHFHCFNDSKTLCTPTLHKETAGYRIRLRDLVIFEQKLYLFCVLSETCPHMLQIIGLNSVDFFLNLIFPPSFLNY